MYTILAKSTGYLPTCRISAVMYPEVIDFPCLYFYHTDCLYSIYCQPSRSIFRPLQSYGYGYAASQGYARHGMSSRAVAPQPEYMVSGCYGHSCGELWRALLAVAVARLGYIAAHGPLGAGYWEHFCALPSRGRSSSNSPSPQDSANLMTISNIANCPVLGGINLCPPHTG